MRKILHEEFWRAVRASLSEDEYRTMVEAFRGQKIETNISDVERRFKKQGELMARSAALNGCDCPGDNEEYYARMFEITRRVLGDELLTTPGMVPSEQLSEELRARITELGCEFDRRERSHPTYDGYICYRDLKP